MISTALTLLSLALAAVASPVSNVARQNTPGPWCDGLGEGAFDIAYDFTLAAYNTTGTNTNSTGAPLVLGQAGAVDGASFKVLSTWASYPYNEFPTISLLNGALIPNGPDPENPISISDAAAQDGQALVWVVTTLDLPTPAQVYCGVASTDPAHGSYPELAVNGDLDSFSLCKTGEYPLAQNNIIYKANDSPNSGYEFSSCYPVKIQILGLY